MRNVICIVLFLLVLTSHARAAELPEDLTDALPDQAAEWMEEIPEDDFAGGVTGILEQMGNKAGDIVRQRVRGAAGVLVVVVLCGILEGAFQGIGGKPSPFLPMVGALSVTLLTAGSLDSLMGLGASTIEDLSVFSRALLPTLAAATAASPMPVLPDVGSMIVAPGCRRPVCSASSIIRRAMRSLALPAGLKDSSFAKMRAPSCSCSR